MDDLLRRAVSSELDGVSFSRNFSCVTIAKILQEGVIAATQLQVRSSALEDTVVYGTCVHSEEIIKTVK